MNNISNKNLLTVLCPNYNNERYISKAVESILMQKCNFNFKVIFIDDCSTDNSVEIINSYVKKYPDKIFLIKNDENLKTLATSIRGYKKVDTPFYTVLDPDDYYIDCNFFQRAIDFLASHTDYTQYVNNTIIKQGKSEKLYFNFQTKDCGFDDVHNLVFGHTSSTVFRNNFTQKNLAEIEIYVNTEYERAFEGDTFRNYFAWSFGKGHYENIVAGVYNYNQAGIWSKLSSAEQQLLTLKSNLIFFKYFQKGKEFFLKNTIWNIQCLKKDIQYQNEVSKQVETLIDYICKDNILNLYGEYKNFAFYLPSKFIGGYEYLFIRLAKYLSERGVNVYYIDYEGTLSEQELKNTKVKMVKYTDGMKYLEMDNVPLNIITPISLSNQLINVPAAESKFYFFVGHPKSFLWTQIRIGLTQLQTKNYFKFLDSYNALCYMDAACYQGISEYVGKDLNRQIVPIFAMKNRKFASELVVDDKRINLGWLGRLDSDKIYSLINVLDNVCKYETDKKINFHIIGDGDAKDLIEVEKYNKKINLIFTSTLINDELKDYMAHNIDLLFAMGTSLLEAASLKIPSVLTLASDNKFNDDKFLLLSDLTDYNLGFYRDDINKNISKYKYKNMKTLLDLIYLDNQKGLLARDCYKYFIDNHSVENTVKMLLRFILNGHLYVKDVKIDNFRTNILINKSILKKQFKLFFYSILLALSQCPIITSFVMQQTKDKLLKKIYKYWR